jgi:CelD/BcsL family acetyltransferase involved in cellulose biosynthesis
MTTMAITECLDVLVEDVEVACEEPAFYSEWSECIRVHWHTNSIYASPIWAQYLTHTSPGAIQVVVLRNRGGKLQGVVPIRIRPFRLRFDIGTTSLLDRNLMVAEVLGSVPGLPACVDTHQRVFDEMLRQWPQCGGIYFDALPTDTYLWSLLAERRAPFSGMYAHVVDGPRPWHLLRLAPSFDAYMKSISSKARANMRREVRQLADQSAGKLQAVRITTPDQVPWFLERAARVAEHSWQQQAIGQRISCDDSSCRSLEELAAEGLLRCYLLTGGDAEYAFVVGYQFGGVYHYAEIAFDERYSEHSPGKVLLTMMLEDLHTHDPPETVNFGVGDASYKRRFGNVEKSDLSCLLLRDRLGNRITTAAHSAFAATVRTAKRLIGRKVAK